ncbi:MAG TPA: GxxExxY protein [Lacunisphaera sp.]|jgi:GxxExxY protein|nr:GxxExxY protein [Lacunisphaera sp.]HQY04926.1 GxxExxY protein [Lacunisphaera sp.]
MDTNTHESEDSILHRDLVFRIVGCAFDVIKEVGHGLHEKPYENALVLAFQDAGISIQQQMAFPILFKARQVGEYIPDLIADGAVIIDTKVIDRITDHERGQMLNYLRVTGLRVGLIINFKRAKMEWERIVL